MNLFHSENWNKAVLLGGVEEDGTVRGRVRRGIWERSDGVVCREQAVRDVAMEEELLNGPGISGAIFRYFLAPGRRIAPGEEIVEDVEPPLPLTTKMCLVKPSIGLSTPTIFKALDLDKRSKAEPLDLLKSLNADGVQRT